MIIHANTKIGAIIKQHPGALEAIVSIHPMFEKLRNPILRKVMAGRASISMAAKMAGCSIQAFYEKLTPLGFEVDGVIAADGNEKNSLPYFMKSLTKDH